MANLKDIVYYLVDKYPHKEHLANARITKMVYLADWYSANVFDKQVSEISWYFDNYGPFVTDVIKMAQNNSDVFSVTEENNYFGATKRVIGTVSTYSPILTDSEIQSLNKVIEITKNKTWDQFITYVYSTYPIIVSDRYTNLDLMALAAEYPKRKREL